MRLGADRRADDLDALRVKMFRGVGEQTDRRLAISAVHGGNQRVSLPGFG
jgi:hypothetical protein